jgi:hypothetical protein
VLAKTADEPFTCFRPALARALECVEREGDLPSIDDKARLYAARESGVSLTVAVSSGDGPARVVAARHRGAAHTWLRATFDSFCRLIEGLPLQEAADHGAIQLIDRLRDPQQPAPVPGILTPRNSGAMFAVVERLIRVIYAQHLVQAGEKPAPNHWNPRLPAGWAHMRKQDQIDLLKPVVTVQLQDEGLAFDDVWINDIQRGLRVTMSFGPGVPAPRKPELLMRIERRMRLETGARLEVYAEEMRDRNVIRRL